MADDILIALASAQLLITQDFDEAGASLQTNVMKAGEGIFHLLTGGLHFLIVAEFIFWSVKTNFGKKVPLLDYLDPVDMVLASAPLNEEIVAVDGLNHRNRLHFTMVDGWRIAVKRHELPNVDSDTERLVQGNSSDPRPA